jgi:nucleolar protein TMA23
MLCAAPNAGRTADAAQQSTLNQIRTQGINRGGLYGFFVKGEGIAGTLSGDETATSADDTDAKSKRKRSASEPKGAKSKKSRKEKKSKKDDGDVVAAKLAKLSVEEKATYTERAAAKGQSLEEYVKRRIEKKAEQRAARYVCFSVG